MNKEIILDNKSINFDSGEDISDFDLHILLDIDYSSLKEDIATFPFIVNQINFLLIEAKSELNKEKFQLDILKDNMEKLKAEKAIEARDILIQEGIKSPTQTAIDGQIKLDITYDNLQKAFRQKEYQIVEKQNQVDYLSSLYWNCKLKAEILTSLVHQIII